MRTPVPLLATLLLSTAASLAGSPSEADQEERQARMAEVGRGISPRCGTWH